jgi:hypothetical protein
MRQNRVLSRTRPAASSIEVVWTVVISCWLKVFLTPGGENPI